MFVKYRSSQDPTIQEFVLPMTWMERWRRRSRRKEIVRSAGLHALTRPPGYELFSDDRTPYGGSVVAQVPSCDVVNLHWIAAYVDYEMFFRAAASRAHVVWTLHDMNAVTGGCHYDMGCGKFAQQCGGCPQLGSDDERDLAAQIWVRKRTVFASLDPRRVCIVAPSQWLARVAKESPVLGRFRVETIPYGIDLQDFAPRDRLAARDVLGIPSDAKVVLFLAEMVDNRRKGFPLLEEALKRCAAVVPNLWLLSVGNNPPRLSADIRGSHLQYIGNDRFLSLAYSAADVFAIPSVQDNLPNTVMEAMACGIPVVGFEVGGIPDMVRVGHTGLLVPPGDVEGMSTAMAKLLQSPDVCRGMGAEARKITLADYPLLTQARRYADLYKDLVS